MTEVITALSPAWEGIVAGRIEEAAGVTIVRRCADVSELLSVAETGLGCCAVVSADLRGLDLSVVGRLRTAGLRVVGVFPSGDDAAERRLRQLSVGLTLAVESSPESFSEAIGGDNKRADVDLLLALADDDTPHAPGTEGGSASSGASAGTGASVGWQPAGRPPASKGAGSGTVEGLDALNGLDDADGLDRPAQSGAVGRGRVIAVWGPTGAPGRTTLSVTLAAELASRGSQVLLVDADTYGGCVGQTLGLLDEAPGIAAACRSAEQGSLDLPSLARLAPEVSPGLRVLTGLPKAERWPEVGASALERVLDLSRALAEVIVIDCGFSLEDDEELSYDTLAPRRNEATLTSLAISDDVLAVGGADPVALQRFVRSLQEVGTVPSPVPTPVVNRVRASAVGSRPESRISESLLRFAGLAHVHFLPDDQGAVDGALLAGRSVVEHAPQSALRVAVASLADAIVPATRQRSEQRSGLRRRTRA